MFELKSTLGLYGGLLAVVMSLACGSDSNRRTDLEASVDAGAVDVDPEVGIVAAVVKLRDLSGAERQYVPVTFSHLFALGAVAQGQALVARQAGGAAVPLQMDVKAHHADGSLRHAVFSLVLSELMADEVLVIELVTAVAAVEEPAVSAADLLSSGFDVSWSIALAGKVYTAELPESLEDAKLWLSGPVASEWIVTAPLVAVGETVPHPNLTAGFSIRAYAGLESVRVGASIENTWAFEPGTQNFAYDATLSLDNEVVSGHEQVMHYRQARWREVVWRGISSQVHVSFEPADLIATGAVPSYDLSVAVDDDALTASLAKLDATNTGPMGLALMDAYMPGTGARPDIGPFTTWAARDLISQDPRARAVTLATGNAAASWSVHYRDQKSGLPVLLTDYPYMSRVGSPGDSVNQETGQSEAFPVCVGACDVPNRHDTAHQPSMAYLPYLYTGDHYFLEELQFWSAYNLLQSNPYYREFGKGLFKAEQVRGQAWALRTLGFTAYITPDEDPLKTYFLDRLQDNIDWYTSNYAENPDANSLGILTEKYVNFGAMAGWMDDFFTWSLGQLVAMDFDEARPMLEWKAKFPVGRMAGEGMCWIMAAPYHLVVAHEDDADTIFNTFSELYLANAQQTCGTVALHELECGSAEMAACLDRQQGEMGGYPTSPAGYPSNLQPALAVAAEHLAPDAEQAWALFVGRSVQPNYSSSPQYNIVPRP